MIFKIPKHKWAKVYLPTLHRQERYKLFYGSRNSAKSVYVGMRVIMRLLSNIPTKGIMVRKIADSIKESQFETIKELVYSYGWEDYFTFQVSPLSIKCINGNRMIALGLDKPTKGKSIKDPNFAWYEEVDELTREDFEQTSLSVRGKNVEEILVTNAPPESHWIIEDLFPKNFRDYESPDGLFTEIPSGNENWLIWHTCYLQNEFAQPDAIEKQERLRDKNPEQYKVSGLGLIGLEQTGQEWANTFSRLAHVHPVEYNPDLHCHLTVDQNYQPYGTGLVAQIERIDNTWHIYYIDEICLPPPLNSTEHLCETYKYERKYRTPYFYGDASGKAQGQRKSKEDAEDHYTVIEKFFGNPSMSRVIKKNPPRAPRRRFWNRLLSGYFPVVVHIDPKCKNFILDNEKLQTDKDGCYLKPKVKDKKTGVSYEQYGHLTDANIYLLYYLFPDWFNEG